MTACRHDLWHGRAYSLKPNLTTKHPFPRTDGTVRRAFGVCILSQISGGCPMRRSNRLQGAVLCAALLPLSIATALAQDAAAPPPEKATIDNPARTYTPDDFTRFAPNNALDMLEQVPGFVIRTQVVERGLGQATGNVLINGQRLSGKSNDVLSQLGRIPSATSCASRSSTAPRSTSRACPARWPTSSPRPPASAASGNGGRMCARLHRSAAHARRCFGQRRRGAHRLDGRLHQQRQPQRRGRPHRHLQRRWHRARKPRRRMDRRKRRADAQHAIGVDDRRRRQGQLQRPIPDV